MVSESNFNHAWSFRPRVSLFVSCNTDHEIHTLFEELSSNGGWIMVAIANYKCSGDYGFGIKFGWCEDKYVISRQLNLLE